jgi:hypothetical protein
MSKLEASPSLLNALFLFNLFWPTLTSPQRLSMAKVNRVAGRQLGTNCGGRVKRNTQRRRGRESIKGVAVFATSVEVTPCSNTLSAI